MIFPQLTGKIAKVLLDGRLICGREITSYFYKANNRMPFLVR